MRYRLSFVRKRKRPPTTGRMRRVTVTRAAARATGARLRRAGTDETPAANPERSTETSTGDAPDAPPRGTYRMRRPRAGRDTTKPVLRTPAPPTSPAADPAVTEWLRDLPQLSRRFDVQALAAGSHRVAFVVERKTRRRLVLKLQRVADSNDWDGFAGLAAEARTLRSLRHAALPRVVEDGDDGGAQYLLTERLPGESLQVRMDRGDRWTDIKLQHLLRCGLTVLRYLHELNPPVFHCDLQPEHIVVSDRGDVGLVSFASARSLLSKDPTVVGRVGYVAAGQPPTESADLHALGATLAAIASGVDASALPRVGGVIDTTACLRPGSFRDAVDRLLQPGTAAEIARWLQSRG